MENNHYDLTNILLEDYKNSRRIGRYRVSDLWAMLNGYLPPDKFLSEEIRGIPEIVKMLLGETKHLFVENYLQKIGFEVEKPIEKQIDDFVIVGKLDAIKDNLILEIKTSDKILDVPKRWHEFQLQTYLSLFQKNVGQIVQPIFNSQKFYLKVLGEIQRDDDWFENKVVIPLREYHKKVVEFYKQNV